MTISMLIRGMQIKPIMANLLLQWKKIIPSAGEYVKKLECLDTAFGNVKCYRHFGKKSNNFFKS